MVQYNIAAIILLNLFLFSCRNKNNSSTNQNHNELRTKNIKSGININNSCPSKLFEKEEKIKDYLMDGISKLNNKFMNIPKFYENNLSIARRSTSLLKMGSIYLMKNKNQKDIEPIIKQIKIKLENELIKESINWKKISILNRELINCIKHVHKNEWKHILYDILNAQNKIYDYLISTKNCNVNLIKQEEIKKNKILQYKYQAENSIKKGITIINDLRINVNPYFQKKTIDIYREKITRSYFKSPIDWIRIRTYSDWLIKFNNRKYSHKIDPYFKQIVKNIDLYLNKIKNKNIKHKDILKKERIPYQKIHIFLDENPGILNYYFDTGLGKQTKNVSADVKHDLKKILKSINNNKTNCKSYCIDIKNWFYIYTILEESLETKGMEETDEKNKFKRKISDARNSIKSYIESVYNFKLK